MPYFAEVIDGTVTRILVITSDKVASGKYCDPTKMVETFKRVEKTTPPRRRNFAEIGGSYNSETDEFLPKQPFPSWILHRTVSGDWWKAPKDYPFNLSLENKIDYEWNEETQEWEDLG